MTDLIPRVTLDRLLTAHDESQALVSEALELMDRARATLSAVCGDRGHLFSDRANLRYLARGDIARMREDATKEIRANCWRTALQVTGIREMMGSKDAKEFDRQFEERSLPPFALENVQATLHGLAAESGELRTRAILEAFDILRPWRGAHKTNDKAKVGKKVILARMIGSYWGLSQHAEDTLRAVDKAFHVLDGKRPPTYPGGLVTAIKTAKSANETSVQTEYFKCKWHKNTNIHIEFLRLDLLRELNRLGGEGRMEMPEGRRPA